MFVNDIVQIFSLFEKMIVKCENVLWAIACMDVFYVEILKNLLNF